MPLDPIQLEVFRSAFASIGNEMSLALQRAAYSTNIKTRLDFSCAVFDAQARMVAQAFTQPVHLGTLTHFVPSMLKEYGAERLRPGDGLLSNDGHLGGIHINDVCLLAPVFTEGESPRLLAYVATIAHHVDIGGGTPGSIGLFQEIFQEGLVIPPTLFLRDGQVDENVFRLILKNVRAPRETGGDMRAQVAGVHIGIRRLRELVAKHGLGAVEAAMDELLQYTERRVRAEVAALPRGQWAAETYLDDDGFGGGPIKVAVDVRVADEGVTFDLSGSDKQRRCPVNTTYAMAFSACAYSLRALIDPDLPMNDGFYRVLNVVAPRGLIVNANRPAAIGAGSETGSRITETAFRAFAQAGLTDRLAADSKGAMCNIGFGGINPRTDDYFVFYEAQAGGYGARATKDGIDAVQPHMQNTENSPVEETEANYPVRIERYALIEDSEGPGRFRGGLGLRRDYRPEGEVMFSVLSERGRFAPQGLEGGREARPAHYVLNPDDPEKRRDFPSKLTVKLEPGDVFSVQMAGGGGFGRPEQRDPDLVLADVLAGKVSAERARNIYLVAVDESTGALDAAETARLRRDVTA